MIQGLKCYLYYDDGVIKHDTSHLVYLLVLIIELMCTLSCKVGSLAWVQGDSRGPQSFLLDESVVASPLLLLPEYLPEQVYSWLTSQQLDVLFPK